MGFYRTGQPRAFDRASAIAYLTPRLAEEIAFANRAADRFGFECVDPGGHVFIGSCGDVVCMHEGCGKVVW
jgi:hypothetical protein